MQLHQRENQQRGKHSAPDNLHPRNGLEPAGALRIVSRVCPCYGDHAYEDSRERTAERGESDGERTLPGHHVHECSNASLVRRKAIEDDYPCPLQPGRNAEHDNAKEQNPLHDTELQMILVVHIEPGSIIIHVVPCTPSACWPLHPRTAALVSWPYLPRICHEHYNGLSRKLTRLVAARQTAVFIPVGPQQLPHPGLVVAGVLKPVVSRQLDTGIIAAVVGQQALPYVQAIAYVYHFLAAKQHVHACAARYLAHESVILERLADVFSSRHYLHEESTEQHADDRNQQRHDKTE